jgi:hypothetical protein
VRTRGLEPGFLHGLRKQTTKVIEGKLRSGGSFTRWSRRKKVMSVCCCKVCLLDGSTPEVASELVQVSGSSCFERYELKSF